jgi:hypothetical protein
VSVIEVDSNRITGIELSIPGCESYFIFSLYLPAITQSSDSFRDHIDLLSELVSALKYDQYMLKVHHRRIGK